MVKPGRQAPPLTVIVRRQAEPEREIPLTDVGEVMWSPELRAAAWQKTLPSSGSPAGHAPYRRVSYQLVCRRGSMGESSAHDQAREARLRADAANLYPGIPPDVWMRAAIMTDIVLSRRLQLGRASLGGRALDPAHFEFRQGSIAVPPGTPFRRRATDAFRLEGD
jgi:hypothetical protein